MAYWKKKCKGPGLVDASYTRGPRSKSGSQMNDYLLVYCSFTPRGTRTSHPQASLTLVETWIW